MTRLCGYEQGPESDLGFNECKLDYGHKGDHDMQPRGKRVSIPTKAELIELAAELDKNPIFTEQPGETTAELDDNGVVHLKREGHTFMMMTRTDYEAIRDWPEELKPVATDALFLHELAERLMHIPVMHGVDQGDAERLDSIAGNLKERMLTVDQKAALVAWANEQHRKGGLSGWGSKFDAAMAVAESFREKS